MGGWRRSRMLRAGALCLALCLPSVAAPQDVGAQRVPRSPVLTLDSSRLLPETMVGQRLVAALEAEGAALDLENRELAETLRAEELELTALRSTLSREEFAARAEAFDAKVQQTRREQDAKQAALQTRLDDQQRALFGEIQPILAQIVAEAGAVVVVELDTVLLSVRGVDVTNIAIARINAALSDDGDDTEAEADGSETPRE